MATSRRTGLLYLAAALLLAIVFWGPWPAQADSDQGYLTDSPMNRVYGLAEIDGRFAIQLGDGCDGVRAGENVALEDDFTFQVIDPVAGLEPGVCHYFILERASPIPCATNADGACDVANS